MCLTWRVFPISVSWHLPVAERANAATGESVSSARYLLLSACFPIHHSDKRSHTHTHIQQTHSHTHTLTHTRTQTHTLSHTHTLTHTHSHTHTPTHTHTRAHTHA